MIESNFKERKKLHLELVKQKEYLDVNDVVLISNLSRSTIFRRISQGILKPFQDVPKGKLLFSKKAVKNWIEGGLR